MSNTQVRVWFPCLVALMSWAGALFCLPLFAPPRHGGVGSGGGLSRACARDAMPAPVLYTRGQRDVNVVGTWVGGGCFRVRGRRDGRMKRPCPPGCGLCVASDE